jgi:hypothetical protein
MNAFLGGTGASQTGMNVTLPSQDEMNVIPPTWSEVNAFLPSYDFVILDCFPTIHLPPQTILCGLLI